MENDVILRKQPGCWLRSSHSFKECVIAHWSSEVARKITGAKLYTEIADSCITNNVYMKVKVIFFWNIEKISNKMFKRISNHKNVYIISYTWVVEEHSIVGRSIIERICGRGRRENAGISSESKVRILAVESLRFPGEGSSAQGKSGPKVRPKGVADG